MQGVFHRFKKYAICYAIAIMYAIYRVTGLILGLCPTNERRRYKVTPSLIGWAQT